MISPGKNEVVVKDKEAHELADFETPFVATAVAPVAWSIEKYRVAQELALSSKTKKQIAKDTGLSVNIINTWLENPDFKAYVQQTVLEGAKDLKAMKLQALTKTLAARIEEAEQDGYATFSRKDSLDVIGELRKETGEESTAQNNYTNLLENLLKHSIPSANKLVDIGGNQ